MMEFVHPGEETAWNALLNNKIFQTVVDVFQSIYADLTSFAAMKGRNFLVAESIMPDIYRIYQTAGERLRIGYLPPLYIQMEYGIKIQTMGTDGDCAILMNSACLEECTEEQMLALFGQELTHVRYQHLRILNIDSMLDTILTKLPWVGPVASQALKTLLLQWKEYAGYTADRGAAIAAGDKMPVYQNLSMAMGKKLDETGVDSVLAECSSQGLVPTTEQSAAAKVVLQMMINNIALPFGIWRIRELDSWDADIQQAGSSLEYREQSISIARKTVDTMDQAAIGIYHGAVKTAEAVKQGKEDLQAYVEENKPVWEENFAQAKIKTADAIKKGKAGLESYVEENKPMWENNLSRAKEAAADAANAGVTKAVNMLKKWKSKK